MTYLDGGRLIPPSYGGHSPVVLVYETRSYKKILGEPLVDPAYDLKRQCSHCLR